MTIELDGNRALDVASQVGWPQGESRAVAGVLSWRGGVRGADDDHPFSAFQRTSETKTVYAPLGRFRRFTALDGDSAKYHCWRHGLITKFPQGIYSVSYSLFPHYI
jgi:hypothetical protein